MNFRFWLQEMWREHCTEFEAWSHRMPDYTLKDYFNRYKWWLRREYRYRNDMGFKGKSSIM